MTEPVLARNEGDRIAFYRISSPSDASLWNAHWEESFDNLNLFYDRYKKGHLGYGQIRNVLLKYLPGDGIILEAGCGLGQYVVALRARGYDCIGVDFAYNTVRKLKKHIPNIPVITGDIRNLHIKSDSISAYISLGVVEHFQEGPHDALREARRVLKKGGKLIISVPQAFKWRRFAASSEDTPLPENASFYQYAFSHQAFRDILHGSGFNVTAEYAYSLLYAFRLRFKTVRKLVTLYPWLSHLDLILDMLPLGSNNSRMRLYVADKE